MHSLWYEYVGYISHTSINEFSTHIKLQHWNVALHWAPRDVTVNKTYYVVQHNTRVPGCQASRVPRK